MDSSSRPAQTVSFADAIAFEQSNVHNIGVVNIDNYPLGQSHKNPWTIPRTTNSFFTGRDDIIHILHHTFEDAANKQSTLKRRFVITGLGGTGKSEVCLKYVEDHGDKYWGCFWVDCSSIGTAKESFQKIGKECAIPRELAHVKSFLSSTTKRWLMIIDNADIHQQDYSQFFPHTKNGDIIITTRDPEISDKYAELGSEPLQQLSPPLACNLLLKAAGRRMDEQVQREAASRVVKALDYHTLAILHAGAYIKKCCDLEDYLQILKTHPKRLYQNTLQQETSEYGTVHQTFEISLSRIETLRDQNCVEGADALDLFNDLALLHNKAMLHGIALKASKNVSNLESIEARRKPQLLQLSKAHCSLLPQYYPAYGADPELKLRWGKAIHLLKATSFISVEGQGANSTISMHPLVHSWALDRLDPEIKGTIWLRVASTLALSCVDKSDDPWEIFGLVQNQVNTCLELDVENREELIRDPEIVPILWQLVYIQSIFDKQARTEQILSLIIHILGDWSPSLASHDQPAHSEVWALKAHCMAEQNHCVEALRQLEAIARLRREDPSGAGHKFLNPLIWLASEYIENQLENKAIALIQDWNHKQCMIDIEADIPGWALMMEICRRAQRGQIDDQEAFNLSVPIAHLSEDQQNDASLHQLKIRHERARNFIRIGESKRAVQEFENILEFRKNQFERDAPPVLVAQHQLAVAYLCNDQCNAAITLLEQTNRAWELAAASDYIDRLTTRIFLSLAYVDDGNADKAFETLYEVLPIIERTLEPQHLGRLMAEQTLARIHMMNGRYSISYSILRHHINLVFTHHALDALAQQHLMHFGIFANYLVENYGSVRDPKPLTKELLLYGSAWHPLAQVEAHWFQLFGYDYFNIPRHGSL